MPRRSGRFLGRAGTARRLLPLSAVAPLLFRCAHARRSRRPLRYAAGRAPALGSVGAGRALSADFVGIEGGPDAAQRLQFRVLAGVFLESGARATRRGGHPPGKGRANRVAVVTAFAARRPDVRSVRRPARPGGKGEPARAAEGGVEAPPAALIAAWLERDVLREGQGRLGGGSNLILPSRENSVMSEGGSTGRMRSGRGVSRLWRRMAGRAGRVGGLRCLLPACFERLPLLSEGGARV
jgi:hypothetical protein